MSGYEKPQDANVNEYDARRLSQAYSSLTEYYPRLSLQDPPYQQYVLPGAADSQLQQPSPAYDQQSGHMNYGVSAMYQPRATLEATSYPGFELGKTLQVLSCNPRRGTHGAPIYISFESSRDLLSPTPLNTSLMFGTCPVPAVLGLEARKQNACYKYSVCATAPPFWKTGCSHLKIPLRLQVERQPRFDADLLDLGSWLYEDTEQLSYGSSPQKVSRKRKVTDEPSDTPRSTKREKPSEQQSIRLQGYGFNGHPSASPTHPPSLDIRNMQKRYTPYGRSRLQQSHQAAANTMELQGLIGNVSTAQSSMRHPMGHFSSSNSSYGAGYQSDRSPQPPAAPSPQVSSVSSPHPANPTFIRTNRIPTPVPSAGSSSDGGFNPYAVYPSKAVLHIHGDLDAMQLQANWTPQERAVKRRIVQFRREQNWTTINTWFRPVKADEQPLPDEVNERRISCIYWEEHGECYVTSVEVIFLLELLFGQKFITAEQNRVRRNLQTYKPCTVHKGGPDSETFFRLIMAMPNPKPRHIVKDLKVYKWRILGPALKKIISRFSADPSSIIGPIEGQLDINFNETHSEVGTGRLSALSSRSRSGSTAYSQPSKSDTFSPPAMPNGLPSYPQASSLQQASAFSLTHSYSVPNLGSPYTPNSTFNSPYIAQVSNPSLSPAYNASTIGGRRSSEAHTDDVLESPNHYYSRRPHTNNSYTNQYTPQGLNDATATMTLPSRTSQDFAVSYLNTDFAPSLGGIGDAQYRRYADVKDEEEMMHSKEE